MAVIITPFIASTARSKNKILRLILLNQPLFEKIKSVKENSHKIGGNDDSEEDSHRDFAVFFSFFGEKAIVRHKKDAGDAKEKCGVVSKCGGKIEPECRKVGACHSAKWARDLKYPISRADVSENF